MIKILNFYSKEKSCSQLLHTYINGDKYMQNNMSIFEESSPDTQYFIPKCI